MLSAYPACFIKEKNGYSVIFPDLNHLATCGATLDEAFAMAVDCLAGYLYWLQQDGEDAPAPSPIAELDPRVIAEKPNASPDEAFISIVTVDVAEYVETHFRDTAKVTLSIPTHLYEYAKEEDFDLSLALQTVIEAAKEMPDIISTMPVIYGVPEDVE